MSNSRAREYYRDPNTGKTEEWVKSSVPLIRPPSMPFAHNVVEWREKGSTFERRYDENGKQIPKKEYYSQNGGTNKKSHKKSHKKSSRKSRRNYHK